MASNFSFPDGYVPPGAAWIGPDYVNVLRQISDSDSPYLYLADIVHKLYHPTVPLGFRTQLYFHVGLFSVCTVLILLGLYIRLRQGRLWIFHRLDRTVFLPNASALFGLCSVIYAALGFWLIASTIEVSKGADLPRYYTGLRVAWFGAIWTGAFFEIWTTIAGWYVRKYGAHYRESKLRTTVAIAIPVVVILIAWFPPVILCLPHAQRFNRSFRISQGITADLLEWQKAWKPGDGLDMAKLATLFTPGSQLGDALKSSHRHKQICSYYCTTVLFLTFIGYVSAASLEISQLGQTVRDLREQAAQRAEDVRSIKNKLPLAPVASSDSSASPAVPQLVYRHSPTPASDDGSSPEYRSRTSSNDSGSENGADAPWALLAWVRRNRIYSAVCIAIMLLAQASVDLWRAMSKLNMRYPSGQFQVEILISCWVHGILATTVSLLLLFHSLDTGSSKFLTQLKTACPWLPFPPSVSNMSARPKSTTSSQDQPPMYATANSPGATSSRGNVIPIVTRPSALASSSTSSFKAEKFSSGSHTVRSDSPSFNDDNECLAEKAPSPPEMTEPQRGVESTETYAEAVERARQRWIMATSVH
ncbi:hypothetical protein JCM10908_000875 [Rhodotorula pacifica]|uniref:uncharacterized protein n=1 Tax=Rhodotorula pacifica TaxID=1495444 RepID=UPI0031760876